jgi:hypothetical protein
MHYEEFRAAWDHALRRGRVISFHDRPEETIDIATMDRRYMVRVGLARALSRGVHHLDATDVVVGPLIFSAIRHLQEDLLTPVWGHDAKRIATTIPGWRRRGALPDAAP